MKTPPSMVVYLRRLILLVPLIAVGAMIWKQQGADLVRWPGVERIYLGSVIRTSEDDYLFAMRDTHLGCLTLQYRPADIVFVGDSHSYAGYDYQLLQARLRPYTVGNCALSGMFPENVIDLIREAKKAGLVPKQLIFGISPEMFWDDEDRRRDRIARAYREIKRINESKESLAALLSGRFKTLVDFRHVDDMKRARRSFDADINNLSEDTIQKFFRNYSGGVHSLDYWIDAVSKSKPNLTNAGVIEKICAAASNSKIRLGLVYIPESRFLVSKFSPEQQAAFRDVIEKSSCADWTDFSFFEIGVAPNLWFVNRYVIRDYPYYAWGDPSAAVAWQEQSPDERRWQFFDPDHMNPKGAAAFSEIIANRLRKDGQ